MLHLNLVTESRSKLRCLQNDRKQINLDIEKFLREYHTLLKNKKNFGTDVQEQPSSHQTTDTNNNHTQDLNLNTVLNSSSACSNPTPAEIHFKPFLIVNAITAGSPSALADLKLDDRICKFGEIEFNNFVGLRQIGEYVVKHENQHISIAFIRNSDGNNLVQMTSLVPKKWSGRGLLGCVINVL